MITQKLYNWEKWGHEFSVRRRSQRLSTPPHLFRALAKHDSGSPMYRKTRSSPRFSIMGDVVEDVRTVLVKLNDTSIYIPVFLLNTISKITWTYYIHIVKLFFKTQYFVRIILVNSTYYSHSSNYNYSRNYEILIIFWIR